MENKISVTIKDIAESNRVKVFEFPDIKTSENKKCPGCLSEMTVAGNFYSMKSGKNIRYGLCGKCGYSGYMDRPTKEWMVNFYSEDWDKAHMKSLESIRRDYVLENKGKGASRYLAFKLASELPLDKNKYVCELGSGYGEVLKNFKDKGFKVIGVENSKHRAELVSEAFGIKVLSGGFEEDKVVAGLSKISPLGLLFTHHVLEHVYDPEEIISKVSKLQSEGDHMVISLPCADGEHINYGLLYFVHLHAFTKESFEMLLNRNGYEVIKDASPDSSNMMLAAKKVPQPKPMFSLKNNYSELLRKRILYGLQYNNMKDGSDNILVWGQGFTDFDHAESEPASYLEWLVRKIFLQTKFKLGRLTSTYSMFVRRNGKCYSDIGSIFEVSYPGKIKFLIK